jgi:hypothetical protein
LSHTNTTSSGTQTQPQPLKQTQTTQTHVQGPSTPPTQNSSSPNAGAIAGDVVGGIVGLTLICLVPFIVMRYRRTRVRLETPDPTLRVPSLQDASTHDSPSAGPSVWPGVSGTGNGNTPGTWFFGAEAMGSPSSTQAFHPYVTSHDRSMVNNNNSSSHMPPPSLPSTLERAASPQVFSFSNTQSQTTASLYPAVIASYTVSRGGGGIYQPCVPQENLVSLPLPSGENPQEVDSGSDGGEYSRSYIDGRRSTVGSLPPPSYRTRTTGR